MLGDTVDGRNPANPVDVVDIPVFTGNFIHPRWLFGISEPSTVCWDQSRSYRISFKLGDHS